MSDKPGLLLFTPNMAGMCAGILHRFDVLKLWEAADPAAAIRERGSNIVAILTTGHDRIDAALQEQLPALKVIVAVGAGLWYTGLGWAGSLGHGKLSAKTLLRMEHYSGACLLILALIHGGSILWELHQKGLLKS